MDERAADRLATAPAAAAVEHVRALRRFAVSDVSAVVRVPSVRSVVVRASASRRSCHHRHRGRYMLVPVRVSACARYCRASVCVRASAPVALFTPVVSYFFLFLPRLVRRRSKMYLFF